LECYARDGDSDDASHHDAPPRPGSDPGFRGWGLTLVLRRYRCNRRRPYRDEPRRRVQPGATFRSPGRQAVLHRVPYLFVEAKAKRAFEQLAIGEGARFVMAGEPDVQRMPLHENVARYPGINAVARPCILRRIRCNPRTHRIQLDVPIAGEQIRVVGDDARLETTSHSGPLRIVVRFTYCV